MHEPQAGGMKGLALHAQYRRAPVNGVAHQGVPSRCQMHAYLMGAPGVQTAAQRAESVVPAYKLNIGACWLAVMSHGHAYTGDRIAPDRSFNQELPSRHLPMRDRQVLTPHITSRQQAHKRRHRFKVLGDDHKARGVLVEPVHDASAGQVKRTLVVCQQAIEQRTAPMTCGRVNDKTCGLVDHHDIGVLVHDHQRHGLRMKCLALCGGHQFDIDSLASLQLARCTQLDTAVNLDVTQRNKRLQMRSASSLSRRWPCASMPTAQEVRSGAVSTSASFTSAAAVSSVTLRGAPYNPGEFGTLWKPHDAQHA
jgi:hypothetical protein